MGVDSNAQWHCLETGATVTFRQYFSGEICLPIITSSGKIGKGDHEVFELPIHVEFDNLLCFNIAWISLANKNILQITLAKWQMNIWSVDSWNIGICTITYIKHVMLNDVITFQCGGKFMNISFHFCEISRVYCQKGPTCHAYAWQIGPFWQDTLDIWFIFNLLPIELREDRNGLVCQFVHFH